MIKKFLTFRGVTQIDSIISRITKDADKLVAAAALVDSAVIDKEEGIIEARIAFEQKEAAEKAQIVALREGAERGLRVAQRIRALAS